MAEPSASASTNTNTNTNTSNAASSRIKPQTAMEVEHTTPVLIPTRLVKTGERSLAESVGTDLDLITMELDADEEQLFQTLNQVAKALENQELVIEARPQVRHVQIRVAGGWVRDKLLGLQTHDVDLALDTCTGVEFATLVKTYMELHSEEHPKIGVIAANPSQSKHLETATMRIHGMDVDFSNLRHEQYQDDSRIPTTIIGTPMEDAYRRDFTMNSLYYNLQTKQIEDWTRHAIRDLRQGLVATPLEAYQTFHDDPLRVLRAIRFAVRYDMTMDDDLQTACQHAQIHKELHRKVSRERVGKELEAMLSGKGARPKKALETILQLKLAGSVFCLPPSESECHGSIGLAHPQPYQGTVEHLGQLRQVAWQEAGHCLSLVPAILKQLQLHADGTQDDARMTYVAVFALPFFKLAYRQKNKIKLVAEYMSRDGIKFKNKDTQAMTTLMEMVEEMVRLLQTTMDLNKNKTQLRLTAGLLLRATKGLWVTALVLGTVVLLRRHSDEQSPTDVDWYQRAHEWYQTIRDMHLDRCWETTPLLNGKAIIEALGLERGPHVGFYTNEEVKFSLMYPEGTLVECLTHLKAVKKEQDRDEDAAARHINKKMHL
jgi:tRNA nucleotidyltransferase (CCA-adding enzyme)